MELKLRAEAEQEFEEAYIWYEHEHPSRGQRFVQAMEQTFAHPRSPAHVPAVAPRE